MYESLCNFSYYCSACSFYGCARRFSNRLMPCIRFERSLLIIDSDIGVSTKYGNTRGVSTMRSCSSSWFTWKLCQHPPRPPYTPPHVATHALFTRFRFVKYVIHRSLCNLTRDIHRYYFTCLLVCPVTSHSLGN
jgi:hypothetical protein